MAEISLKVGGGARGVSAPRAVLRIAFYTIRRRRLAPITWGLPLSLMSVLVAAIFPSIKGADLQGLIESYPKAIKEAFHVTDASFQTIQGYMSAEVFSLIAPLVLCFFVIRTLADAVCGSEQRRALDVILSAPILRRELVAGHFLGVTTVLLGIVLVFGAITWISALAFGADLPIGDAAAGALNLMPLALFFGGMTLLLAGLMHNSGAVQGAVAATLFAMYLVDVLGTLSNSIDFARPFTAFYYYGSAIQDGIDLAHFTVLLGAGVLLAIVGAFLFERRDIL